MGNINFNPKHAIDSYIRDIKAQGSITESDAKELSSHLSDAIEHLQRQGLSQEEAFIVACKRLGTEDVLTLEYSKVNPSVSVNKIWAYLFLGFNFLYGLPSLLILMVSVIYLITYKNYGNSTTSTVIVCGVNLLFIAGVFLTVKQKQSIANFVEAQVKLNPFRIVAFSFFPVLLRMLLYIIPGNMLGKELSQALYYPVYTYRKPFTEFTLYLALFSVVFAALSLVFSTKNTGKLTLKMLFEKPSIIFLLLYGVIIELLAASTRSLNPNGSIVNSACIFGAVYFIAAFLITYHNKTNQVKYIAIFSFLGLIAEIAVGVSADADRGGTHFTIYFVSALLFGLFGGGLLGFKLQGKGKKVSSIA